jgi:GNAT superfamily N-acetyltransferase
MIWTPERKYDAAFRAPMSRALLRPDTRVIERPGWYQLVTPSAPRTHLNEVIVSDLAPSDAERTIDEVIATYAVGGHAVKWCVGPWTRPNDFGERLTRRGFSSWDVRGMVAETSLSIDYSRGVAVDEITEASAESYVHAAIRGWSLPLDQMAAELDSLLFALRASPRKAHFFAARISDQLIGTAALIVRGDYAYLLATQVLPPFRGRGAYRALVGARLAFLAGRGITLAATQAREATSAPILEHLGFETAFRSKCYLLDPYMT